MKFYRNIAALSLWLMMLMVDSAFALEKARATVGPATFQVETAQTEQERRRGLMFRREMPPDHGMLFVQPPGPAMFWMKNTYIPLDLLYFDAEGRLLHIEANAQPCATPDCPIYAGPTATVRYILEINGGEAARRGIQPGDRLQLD